MSNFPAHVGTWRTPDVASIKAGHGTRPVVIAKAGTLGTRFHALTASQTTASALTARMYIGALLNQVGTTPALAGAATDLGGTAAVAGLNAITRSSGSFITDGWQVDDLAILIGSTTLANAIAARVTAVASGQLTFIASSFATNETLPAGAQLYRAGSIAVSTIAANAGNAAGTSALDVLSDGKPFVDASPNRNLILGPGGAVFMALASSLSAGSYVDLLMLGGNY